MYGSQDAVDKTLCSDNNCAQNVGSDVSHSDYFIGQKLDYGP